MKDFFRKLLQYLLDRFSELSTYVALFNLLAYLGIMIKPELKDIITNLLLALDALVLYLINEHGNEVRQLKTMEANSRLK